MMASKIHSVKAKLRSKFPTSTIEDRERLKRACSTAVCGLEITLNIVKEAALARSAALPGLQESIGGLLFVIGVIKVRDHYHTPFRI